MLTMFEDGNRSGGDPEPGGELVTETVSSSDLVVAVVVRPTIIRHDNCVVLYWVVLSWVMLYCGMYDHHHHSLLHCCVILSMTSVCDS